MIFAQILADWLAPLTVIAASIAAVAAILNLWYGALRGPHVALVGAPDFTVHNVPKNATSIPTSAEIHPKFVFVNSGSTTGVITLDLSFIPSSIFERLGCCNRCNIRFVSGNQQAEVMPPLFLQERESGLVEVHATVDLGDWKSYVAHHDEVDENSICSTLLKADDANKERFTSFCAQLKERPSLGTLSVSCIRTKRKCVIRRYVPKRRDVIDENVLFANESIGIDDDSIATFTSYLHNWDNIQPRRVIELLRDVEPKLERFFSKEMSRCEMIRRQINRDEGTVQTWRELWDYTWYGRGEDSEREQRRSTMPTRDVLDFILRSSRLDFQMQEFSKKAEEFNYTRRLWNRIHKDGEEPKDLLKSMEKQRQELIASNIEIQKTGDRVTQIIKNCVAEALVTTDKSSGL